MIIFISNCTNCWIRFYWLCSFISASWLASINEKNQLTENGSFCKMSRDEGNVTTDGVLTSYWTQNNWESSNSQVSTVYKYVYNYYINNSKLTIDFLEIYQSCCIDLLFQTQMKAVQVVSCLIQRQPFPSEKSVKSKWNRLLLYFYSYCKPRVPNLWKYQLQIGLNMNRFVTKWKSTMFKYIFESNRLFNFNLGLEIKNLKSHWVNLVRKKITTLDSCFIIEYIMVFNWYATDSCD